MNNSYITTQSIVGTSADRINTVLTYVIGTDLLT